MPRCFILMKRYGIILIFQHSQDGIPYSYLQIELPYSQHPQQIIFKYLFVFGVGVRFY